MTQLSTKNNIVNIFSKAQAYLLILACLFILSGTFYNLLAAPPNEYIVPLCRHFSKDLFDLNMKPYLSPTLSVVNSTSNAGFSHSAYVPAKVDRPYFRFTINTMTGWVPNSMKTYKPALPTKEYDINAITEFLTMYPLSVKDTAGLINYVFQNMLYTGITNEAIDIPESATTALGNTTSKIQLARDTLLNLLHLQPLYPILKEYLPEVAQILDSTIGQLNNLDFHLPAGGNVNNVIIPMPQIEIGSLFGTELLLRLIPPIDLGEWVGDFSFWGVGLKHSLSQYFYKDSNRFGNTDKRPDIPPFDMAVQVAYQRTTLKNNIGITKAELSANANIFDINVQFSKNFSNMFEVYAGLSYENIDISGTYKYLLPVELQYRIGLMRLDETTNQIVADPPEYPGDQMPQTSEVSLTDSQFRGHLGAAFLMLDPVILFADYNISKFNILSAGIQLRF